MPLAAYVWERLCLVSFAAPCAYVAFTAPGYYGHLTYWTLSLHIVYFAVDKASPYAKAAVYLLHGASFCGAMAVAMGYSFISIFGKIHHGSWVGWENAVALTAGTLPVDASGKVTRSFEFCLAQKLYEHAWPVLAVLVDTRLSGSVLRKVYAGAPPRLNMLLSMGLYLGFATVWEQANAAAHGDTLVVYQQPPWLKTDPLLARLGVGPAGLPDDFVFVITQKVCCISFAGWMYYSVITPLMAPAKPKKP